MPDRAGRAAGLTARQAEERAKREKEWAEKKRAERQKEITDMRAAGILGE